MSWSRAVVIGAAGGIGSALTGLLQERGTATVALGRSELDVTDENSIAGCAQALAGGDPIDLVLIASGILAPPGCAPEKALRDVDPAAAAHVFAVNTIGPLLVAKHFVPLLPRAGRSAFAVLGARVGSIADNRLGGWYSYRASKAALAMIVRTLAVELARSRPEAICAALHPGTVATDLSAPFQRGVAADRLFAPERSAAHLLDVLDRLTTADSGGHFAWDGSRIAP